MIIAVRRGDVEHHPPKGFGTCLLAETELLDLQEELGVVVHADLFEVEMPERA